ncbi:pyruvate dehydrogenase (acetyl-transferring) E1 component subunit alpha [Promicromonospora soli]|uniref:Pyruvate dehydrogenase E1 component alpha subunit n=1 Tax=Promicromonospora soli TaxID=2035533 RepID=A0A919FSY9_9MICO|nr:pyruvate dehydrogenase (acetyl-transferring) E1 component subunit alpha [Promicromonospora soli]GHH71414.1 pyruvate dehydrogenase E1 component alpha subunit [Promicromonospora soli]
MTTTNGSNEAIPTLQLLDPQGNRATTRGTKGYRDRAAALTPEDLRGMYRDMVLTRRFDEEATSLQRQGELALYAPSRGQEAAQVGSAYALRPQDFVFPSYREHGVLQVRGVDPVDRLRFFRGSDHGGWDPNEHNAGVYSVVIGAHTLHATGYAMGVQRDGTPHDKRDGTAVIAYFGDGATSQGDVNEAMVFAAVNNAPVVFFLQNNQWAISEPTIRQTKIPLYQRGAAFGLPSLRVDGNDVLAVYAATQEALERARMGEGPSFIEAYTYRMGAHTTSDDPTRYRTSEQEEEWRGRDPIDRLAAYLRAEGELDEAFEAQVKAAGDEIGAHLRTGVRALDGGAPVSTFDHVYATPHGVVSAERAWYEAYEAGDPPAQQYAIAETTQGGAR